MTDQLEAYRQRACVGKVPLGERAARELATRVRAEEARSATVAPYACPFCHGWHVGHALGLDALVDVARLLRARSGNAPGAPGSGSTRRARRKVARRQATNPVTRGPLPDDDASPVGS